MHFIGNDVLYYALQFESNQNVVCSRDRIRLFFYSSSVFFFFIIYLFRRFFPQKPPFRQ